MEAPTAALLLALVLTAPAPAETLPLRLGSGPLWVHEFADPPGGGAITPLITPQDTALEVRVFIDTDEDGAWDDWDPLVPARRVSLRRSSDGKLLSTTSTLGGSRFSRLSPGRYAVSVDGLPRGLHPAGDSLVSVEVEEGGIVAVGFPMRAERTISGPVWLDVDRDGRGGAATGDESEDVPAAGVVLFLSDGQETLTDEEGRYRFTGLPPGLFEVVPEYPTRPVEVEVGEGVSHRRHVDFALPERALAELQELRHEDAALIGGEASLLQLLAERVHVEPGNVVAVTALAGLPGELPRDVSEVVMWRVEDPSVARVDGGKVAGLATGTTRLRCEIPGVRTSPWIPVEVSTTSVVDLRVLPSALDLSVGDTAFLEAQAMFWDGRRLAAVAEADWSTLDPAVAEVDALGVLHALQPGETEIYAEWQGVLAHRATVVVQPDPQ